MNYFNTLIFYRGHGGGPRTWHRQEASVRRNGRVAPGALPLLDQPSISARPAALTSQSERCDPRPVPRRLP